MNFVAIHVRSNNLMYMVYGEQYAISVDSFDPKIIEKALSCNFEKNFYTSEEIKQMTIEAPKRVLLASLTTHSHFDHSDGDKELKKMYPDIKQISGFRGDICVDKQKIQIEKFEIECIETKCHTQDSFCFYVNGKWLFTGDTIFFLGCGYFNGGTGSQMAEAFLKIKSRVNMKALMLYGHDYRNMNIAFTENIPEVLVERYTIPKILKEKMWLTLEEEVQFNPFYRVLEVGGDKASNMLKMREAKNVFNKKL